MQNKSTVVVDSYTTPSSVVAKMNVSIEEVANTLEKNKIRHLPIVDEKHTPIGIISDRDIKMVSSFGDLKALQAKDLMSYDPYIVYADTPLEDVVLNMSKNKIGSAIVLYPEDESIGIFTSTDALNALVEVIRELYGDVVPPLGNRVDI